MLLGFFGLVTAVSIGLIAWRGDRLRSPGRIDSPVSREGAFLLNNLGFAAFAFVVLLGTVFPLVIEAVNGSRITVGEPYFNRMTGPIAIALLFLMGVAPALPWRKASAETLRSRLFVPACAGVVTVVVAVALGAYGFVPLLVFGLGGFVAGSASRQIVLATRRQGWRGFVGRTNGGMIVHIGVVILAVGFAASSAYTKQLDFTLEPGQTASISGHTVTFESASSSVRGNVRIQTARVRIDGNKVYAPQLKQFANASTVVGTPSVQSTPVDDVYLSLLSVSSTPNGPIELRVIIEPMVAWIWTGGGIIFVGSFMAAFPGRRRRPTDPASAPVPEPIEVNAAAGESSA